MWNYSELWPLLGRKYKKNDYVHRQKIWWTPPKQWHIIIGTKRGFPKLTEINKISQFLCLYSRCIIFKPISIKSLHFNIFHPTPNSFLFKSTFFAASIDKYAINYMPYQPQRVFCCPVQSLTHHLGYLQFVFLLFWRPQFFDPRWAIQNFNSGSQ